MKITRFHKFLMMNPFIQAFKFVYLSLKIMLVVALGHGSTRDAN